MDNGILIERPGKSTEFLPLRRREELHAEPIQQVLRKALRVGGARLYCGCGEGERYPLYLRAGLAEDGTQERLVQVVRASIEAHRPGCVLEREGDDTNSVRVLSPSMFCRSEPVSPRAGTGDDSTRSDWYDSFSSFIHRCWSEAEVQSFSDHNCTCASWAKYRRQPMEAVFAALDFAFRAERFIGGLSAYEAARRNGGILRFGVITDSLVDCADVSTPCFTAWWWGGDGMIGQMVGMQQSDFSAAAEALRNRSGKFSQPPYFFAAVQEKDGMLRMAYLHKAYFDGRNLVPTDSGYEDAMTADLLTRGLPFLKPLRIADYEAAPGHMLLPEMGAFEWACLPDFLVFWRDSSSEPVLVVTEVWGFRARGAQELDGAGAIDEVTREAGGDEYDTRRIWKAAYYQSLVVRFAKLRYRGIDGWSLKPVGNPAETWIEACHVPVSFDGIVSGGF